MVWYFNSVTAIIAPMTSNGPVIRNIDTATATMAADRGRAKVYTFVCRKAYRLAYRSQRETRCDRARACAFALRGKLGDDGGIGDYVTKPKGRHWRTFERAMGRIDQAEDIVRGHAFLLLDNPNRVASR